MSLVYKVNSIVHSRKDVNMVGIPLSNCKLAMEEIGYVENRVTKNNIVVKNNSSCGFILGGELMHENVELKTVLLRNKCQEELNNLINNKCKI